MLLRMSRCRLVGLCVIVCSKSNSLFSLSLSLPHSLPPSLPPLPLSLCIYSRTHALSPSLSRSLTLPGPLTPHIQFPLYFSPQTGRSCGKHEQRHDLASPTTAREPRRHLPNTRNKRCIWECCISPLWLWPARLQAQPHTHPSATPRSTFHIRGQHRRVQIRVHHRTNIRVQHRGLHFGAILRDITVCV